MNTIRDCIKCPVCGGTGGTERVETVWRGGSAYPQYAGTPCAECRGEGFVEAPAADDHDEAARAA